MPRREYPPPLKIENLSTGIDPTLVDDFTGELLPQPEAKPLASAQDLIDDANRAKVAKAKLTLERVGILKPSAPKDGRLCVHNPDGRLSQPTARPWTDRLSYAKRTSVRRMMGEDGLGQPAIPKAEATPRTRLVITLKPKDWRRI